MNSIPPDAGRDSAPPKSVLGPPATGRLDSTGARTGYRKANKRATDRHWVHVLLFLLTLASTTLLGSRFAYNFDNGLPPYSGEGELYIFVRVWREPSLLLSGLPYSLTLMAILTAHELGHYAACRFYRVDASLPYFMPFPSFIGTLGAFIRFRAPVYTRRALFDIGIAGPLAGFAVLLPAFAAGLAYSKVMPGVADAGEIRFGAPAIQWLLESWVFPGVDHGQIYLHPIARAAWVGVLATALNLLPVGQLDGGHIVYALTGRRHTAISTLTILCLLPLGLIYQAWWLWAALLYFLGRRHFPIYDEAPLGAGRMRLAWLSLALFLLCFIPAPLVFQAPGESS